MIFRMVLTVLAIASVVALGCFAYRIVWVTRDAGPFRVSRIPLVPLQGGGGG